MTLHDLTLTAAARLIRDREFDAAELARALVSRHDALESRLHVMVSTDAEGVLERAITNERTGGNDLASTPFAGAPIGVKDIYDCAGFRTLNGVRGASGEPAARSAVSVERLTRAGALVFGKTVTTDRAFLDSGPTRNPWNTAHTPGGSSSGSAAGVAAGYFPLAIGSQTAGSVIRPAAFCGVFGMTMTHGRVPLEGVLPLAPSFDTIGFFARGLDDLELVCSVLCAAAAAAAAADDDDDVRAELTAPRAFGFVRDAFMPRVDADAARVTLAGVDKLSVGVEDFAMPACFDDFGRVQPRVFAHEAARVHREAFARAPATFGPKIARLVEDGLEVSDSAYRDALALISGMREEVLARFGDLDVLILPSTRGGAPAGLESTGDPLCNAPWTAFGFPALTVPAGFTEGGLPLGVQLVARPFDERRLLRCARVVSETLDHGCPSPPLELT